MPDKRVEAAMENWAPRFVSQGVDFNDFQRVTSAVERWPEWLPAWVANGDMHAALAREAEGLGRRWTAGEAWKRAALSYHFAKFVWMVDMDAYRAAGDKAGAGPRPGHPPLDPRAQRLEIPFEVGTMYANLRTPDDGTTPPLVILLPGLDSTKEEFFEGETGYTTPIYPNYEVAVSAALDHLDWPAAVGLAGVSLGGYYAPRAAAFEPRVAAAVGVSGPWNFGEVWDNRPSLTKETFQHHSHSSSLEEARDKAFELSLEGVAERITQPLLVITGKQDRLVLWEESKKIADAAPNATWVLFQEGSHVCNNIPYKYRPLTADWLKERLS